MRVERVRLTSMWMVWERRGSASISLVAQSMGGSRSIFWKQWVTAGSWWWGKGWLQMSSSLSINISMERSQKVKALSTRRTEKNLPSLKSSMLLSKAVVALTKVDIDSRAILREKPLRTTAQIFEKEHQRSQSGFALRRPKDAQPTAEARQVSFKLQLRDVRDEPEVPSGTPCVIEKAKVSSKSYGSVRAYSANSHSGPVLSYNQDRICIVTNLTKTSQKGKQISFFGVYDGSDGVGKADYMRDHYHLMLAEDPAFPNDMETAMRRTLRKLTHNFAEDPRYFTDESAVAFALILVVGEQVHYLQSGLCRGVFSQQLGATITSPSQPEQPIGKKSKSLAELGKRGGRLLKEGSEVEYREWGGEARLDFALLGSEGIFENLKPRELGRRVWLALLRQKLGNVHFAVGEANNQVMGEVFGGLATKNASLIVVGLGGVEEVLEGEDEVVLPFMGR